MFLYIFKNMVEIIQIKSGLYFEILELLTNKIIIY